MVGNGRQKWVMWSFLDWGPRPTSASQDGERLNGLNDTAQTPSKTNTLGAGSTAGKKERAKGVGIRRNEGLKARNKQQARKQQKEPRKRRCVCRKQKKKGRSNTDYGVITKSTSSSLLHTYVRSSTPAPAGPIIPSAAARLCHAHVVWLAWPGLAWPASYSCLFTRRKRGGIYISIREPVWMDRISYLRKSIITQYAVFVLRAP